MQEHLYPTVLRGYTTRCKVADLERWMIDAAVCAEVEVNTDEPIYPVMLGHKLCFPVGRFRANLCTPELQYAMLRGHIDNVRKAAIYNHDDLFGGFVHDFYTKRLASMEAGDTVASSFYKVLMNSLYGKFGQHGLVYQEEGVTNDLTAHKWTEIDAHTGQVVRWRQFGGLRQRQATEKESRESHPAIAAHVTAYARMLLWGFMQSAGHRNFMYCDTDSLLLNARGYHLLQSRLDSTALGELKLEWSGDEATIHGAKDYIMGDRKKTKGVKRNAVWTGENVITQERWSSLRGLIDSGQIVNPTTRKVVKRLRRVYDKGTVGDDGWVSPLVLGDGNGSGE